MSEQYFNYISLNVSYLDNNFAILIPWNPVGLHF